MNSEDANFANWGKKPKTVFGLIAAGGFAREVMPIARTVFSSLLSESRSASAEIYFVEKSPNERQINGVTVISESAFLEMNANVKYFNVAIADSRMREKIAERLVLAGAKPLSLKSPDVIIYDENTVGDGAILCAHSMVTSNAHIGKFFHSNIYSYVAHDCVIGDYVTFAPRVHCNGNVHIRDHAYIGTCAIIKHGLPGKPLIIGEGAIVGMGAVVTKDVPPFTTVVGNPAKRRDE